MDKMHRAGGWEGVPSPHDPSRLNTLPKSPRVHQPGNSLSPSFWVFMEDSLCSHDWLSHWASVMDSTSSPSSLPEVRGQDPIMWLGPHP